ncbi:hypothetical protein MMC16_000837 [Acarospora aff. strigata]|nr:hypothetical protein [Acarospora aff. strigata]
MASTRAAVTSLAGRAVHIKIHPRPQNLSESRQILRVLERFGEVAMFKNLRYEYQAPAPNSALAIYQHASSASKLLDASPIRFALREADTSAIPARQETRTPDTREIGADASREEGREPQKLDAEEIIPQGTATSSKWGSTFSNTRGPTKTGASVSKPAEQPPPSRPAVAQSIREFQVTADISTFNHQAYIERQAHYWGFNVDFKTLVAEDLAASVPSLGLVDILTQKAETPIRIQNKRAEEFAQSKTLRQSWEEGMRGIDSSPSSEQGKV